ncbi:MAG: FadR/GntR family transcriptional regulator [bacterium]|nr:FadR/GntR family transcriptional regulator [bacterium]
MGPAQEKNTPPAMPVKSERLSSQISKLILSEIQSGQLTVGDKLPPETELAQRYGVSRTILREAIASLKNEDILESRQGRGIIVKNARSRQAFRFSDVFETVSMDEVNYFYEMRALLESEAAGLAAMRRTREDIDEIAAALRGMEEAVAENAPGAEAHDRYNAAIARASHNPVLIEFLLFLQGKLHDLAKELRIKTMASPERAHTVLEEHRRVVKYIMAKEPAAAQEAALTHLKNAAERAGIEIYHTQTR